MNLVYVACGGALGAVLRYLMVGGINRLLPMIFPLGTLTVNVLGSFVLGIIMAQLARISPDWQRNAELFLAVGVMGGFTTFSSFSAGVVTLVQQGLMLQAVGYITASVVLSVLALAIGFKLAIMMAS